MSVTLGEPIRRLAHLRGHHVLYGTAADCDTARRGESLYGFAIRTAFVASRDAIRSERQRLSLAGRSLLSIHGDVTRSIGLQGLGLLGFAAIGGWAAAGVMFLAFLLTKVLLEGFNYFQHYGLVCVSGTRPTTRHVWSHLTPVVRAISYEISNHAHHHMDQQVPFHQLKPDPKAPQMPSIILCFLCALVPPLWTKLIAQPHLRHWDLTFANPEERALAAQANAAAGWPDWLTGAPLPEPSAPAPAAARG
jgi:alkane 1-monooxygenase